MQLARRPDVTFPMVAALLQKEPLLATQVLRIAQSPVYRRAEPVRSLEQAASLLGLRALADLFLQASLTARVFRAPAYEGTMNRLRDHAVATAITARLVCRETAFSDDYAFLCGLLHDVGTAACIIVLADSAARGKTDPLPLHLVWPVINGMHEAMSRSARGDLAATRGRPPRDRAPPLSRDRRRGPPDGRCRRRRR